MRLAGLLSGGKDSVYAAHLAQRQGHQLAYLVSLRSRNPDSYMFHTVNIDLTRLQAEAWQIEYREALTEGEKENFFIYKKTPSGVGRIVKAKLLQGWLVAIPIGVVISAVSMILIPQITFGSFLTHTGLIALVVAGNTALALGLSLLNPVFSESARAQMGGLMLNAQVGIFVSIGIFIGSMVILRLRFIETLILYTVVVWLLGVVSLYLGKRKLYRIE